MPILVPGILHVPTSRTDNAFLIEGDDGLTLVDVGRSAAVSVLLRALTELGAEPARLRRIVLTHAHPDHVQGVAEMREHTGASILIHSADADWLRAGRVPASGRSGAGARRYDATAAGGWTAVEPSATVEDGELIAGCGLRVIHTPGHSPGHIALLHEPTGAVLVGDAVFHSGKLGYGPATFAAEPDARASAAARIPADVSAVGFGHGAPLTGPDVEAFRAFLAPRRRNGRGR